MKISICTMKLRFGLSNDFENCGDGGCLCLKFSEDFVWVEVL